MNNKLLATLTGISLILSITGLASVSIINEAFAAESISSFTLNVSSAKWGITTVTATMNAAGMSPGSTYFMRVNWGNGTTSDSTTFTGGATHTFTLSKVYTNAWMTNPSGDTALTVGGQLLKTPASLQATATGQSLTLQRHTTTLNTPTLSTAIVPWGKTFSVTATTLTDSDAAAGVSSKSISYSGTAVGSAGTGTTTTGGGLTASVSITAKGFGVATLGVGQTVTASFAGDAAYASATSTGAQIQVRKHLTSLDTPTLGAASVKWGKTFTASTVIHDLDDSTTISGRSVTFIGSAVQSSGTGTTDGSGNTGSVTVTAKSTTGTGGVRASFATDAWYWQSQSSSAASINLLRHATAFTSAPDLSGTTSATFPGTIPATIKLVDTDASNAGVNSATIVYSGTAITTETATTNASGDGGQTLDTKQTGNNLTIHATFGGNALYAPASVSPNATVNVS